MIEISWEYYKTVNKFQIDMSLIGLSEVRGNRIWK